MANKRKARSSATTKGKKKRERLKPISLHPAQFDDVMRALVGSTRKRRPPS